MAHSYNSLSNCIASLNESVWMLSESVKVLDETTQDVPRLKRVLSSRQVFGLVPESDLVDAKDSFKNEIEPQINEMVGRIEMDINRLQRKRTNLQSKFDLQAVRLASSSKRESMMGLPLNRINKDKVDETKLARLRFLKNKKERLKYSLSRLDLQDQKARLSMIPSLPYQ